MATCRLSFEERQLLDGSKKEKESSTRMLGDWEIGKEVPVLVHVLIFIPEVLECIVGVAVLLVLHEAPCLGPSISLDFSHATPDLKIDVLNFFLARKRSRQKRNEKVNNKPAHKFGQ